MREYYSVNWEWEREGSDGNEPMELEAVSTCRSRDEVLRALAQEALRRGRMPYEHVILEYDGPPEDLDSRIVERTRGDDWLS